MLIYVCGITPYDVGHLGHARVFAFFDTVRRYLEFNALQVRHVQNITDVDDDMVRMSDELGLSIAELTAQNQATYLEEMDALNVLRPDAFPTVTQSMDTIIAMVERLVTDGRAYVADGGYIFFDGTLTPDFGALAGLSRDALRNFRSDSMPAEPVELKRDSLDFLLWQPSSAPGATFDSPWGEGRPGWHVECSAIAHASLGAQLDIHGGGTDLVYPHHDSEIVQSQAFTGRSPYVGTWMHVGPMQLDGVKMSKSIGNLVKVSELLASGHTADAIRLYLHSQHYREPHSFVPSALEAWEQQASALRTAVQSAGGPSDPLLVQHLRSDFIRAMDNDFDTAGAVRALLAIARGLTEGRLAGETAVPALLELADVMGLRLGREG